LERISSWRERCKLSFPSNGRTEKWVSLDLVDKQGQATQHTHTHNTQERERERE